MKPLTKKILGVAALGIFLLVTAVLTYRSYKSLETWKTYVLQNFQADSKKLADAVVAQFYDRYSDAQALALNEEIRSILVRPNSSLQEKKRSRALLNEYGRLYQAYTIIFVTDKNGIVQLVNTRSPRTNQELPSGKLIGRDFSNEPCFVGAKELFSQASGATALFGTHVEQPSHDELTPELYDRSFETQTFSVPVKSNSGAFVGVVCMFAGQKYYGDEVDSTLKWVVPSSWSTPVAELRSGDRLLYSNRALALRTDLREKKWVQVESRLEGPRFLESLNWKIVLKARESDLFAEVHNLTQIFIRIAVVVMYLLIFLIGIIFYYLRTRNERRLKFELELSDKIVEAQEAERESISQEMHDELGQNLTLLNLEFSHLKPLIHENPQLEARLKSITHVIDQSTQRVRDLTARLSPSILKNIGLHDAVKWQVASFEEKSGIPCEVSVSPDYSTLGTKIDLNVYRIVQEFLTNVARHSQASQVKVKIVKLSDRVFELSLQDDGIGFDVAKVLKKTRSLGIYGMKRRALSIGGDLVIKSSPLTGTLIFVRIADQRGGSVEAYPSS